MANVEQSRQTISFCGVGAHHQSGVAEHRVRELTEMARTQLLHAMHNNPKAVNVHLWPYALRHASYLFNHFPRHGKTESPLEIFSSSRVRPNLQHLHPFGCPVYVLAHQLQNHQKLPRWNTRTHVGVYLGHSPYHAASVGLILSLDTGLVSPQFHCTYDDLFHTPKLDNHAESKWQELAGFDPDNPETFEPPTDTYSPDEKFFGDFTPPESDDSQTEGVSQSEGDNVPFSPSQEISPPPTDTPQIDESPEPNQAATQLPDPAPDPQENVSQQSDDEEDYIQPPPPAPDPSNPQGLRRSTRQRTSPNDYVPQFAGKSYETNTFLSELIDTAYAFAVEVTHAYAYAATQADPDTMTLKQAMQEPDADKFLEAMIKEIDDHVQRKHWKLVTDKQMRATGHTGKPIMGVWSMKRKRNPVGEIVKYKARFCAHGGQTKEGVHYTNTFAPVITWTTIRFLLILSLVHNWHTRQINFVLAYPQAKVSHDLYMLVPDKFKVQNGNLKLDQAAPPPWQQRYKMKLLQNLYGLKDAGATWFNHLKKGLLDRGFKQSQVDPCLFYKKDLILITYVDDCILISPNPQLLDEWVTDMKRDYTLEDEGDINAYLGINVTRPSKTSIKLNQPALIQRIIDSLNLKDQRQHDTPADSILFKDSEGDPRKTDFHYRSLIGQLNYLTSSTRPDIQFATHQCSRFSIDPKHSHEVAAKRIVRYLKRTADEGITMTPDQSKGFECYVDADFAGTFNKLNASDPMSCLSRTGYVISYANCPILWSSKMQSIITLSTTEAEYIALSAALRDVIYILQLVTELQENGFHVPTQGPPKVSCRVFEDNAGALELANNPKLRPRTKHIAIPYHHFRHHVNAGTIIIEKVATQENLADIFTKPLPLVTFRYLRRKLLGW